MPETASAGTVQDADTAQLPQSTSPVRVSVRQGAGSAAAGTLALTVAICRAPLPWYQPSR